MKDQGVVGDGLVWRRGEDWVVLRGGWGDVERGVEGRMGVNRRRNQS